MGPLDKRPRPNLIDQPVDFGFMSPSRWLEFNCELYDAVAALQLDLDRIESGQLVLRDGTTIALLQLAQLCHLRSREEWHELIGEHLISAVIAHTPTPVSATEAEQFSTIDLRVRLVPDDPADAGVFEALGARPYAEGVVQVLAADVPGALRPVPVREVEELGWDADAAWTSAWAQTVMLEQPDDVNIVDVGGAEMLHVFSDRPLTASLVEAIPDVIGPLGEFGAIVSIPHGYSLLLHSIEGASVSLAINAMIPITRRLYRQGPSPVSPHLYWWHDGLLTWMPTYFAPDGIEAYPPPGLIDALRRGR